MDVGPGTQGLCGVGVQKTSMGRKTTVEMVLGSED